MRRKAKRLAARDGPLARKVKACSAKYVASATPLPSSVSVDKLPIARGGFVAVNQDVHKATPTLEELEKKGYAYREWDGMYVSCSFAEPVADSILLYLVIPSRFSTRTAV